jgi:hypothetical protein
VTSNGTSTNYSYLLHTNASATTGTLSADSTLSIPGVGTNFSYTSGPYKLTSTTTGGSLAGFEYSDGNGTDGTTWVGRREFGTILGMGATTEYIAPVSDQSTTCTTYNDDGTTKDTQTLTSSNSEVYGLSSNAFGTGAAVTYEPNQWYMKCDKPVYAWWQYILDDQKHTVTWPMMRQFTYPTPTTSISGSEELTPHPISFWKLDEGAENTCTGGTNDACDSAAGKNDGTNTATRLTDTSCVSGKCLSFDGNDDVVTISNDNDIDFDLGINDGFSVSFWVKALSDGENNTGEIIEKGSHFYCRTDTEAGGFADLECSINLATTDPTVNITDGLTIGQWHHVEATYADDGDDDLLVYIDGLLRGTGAGDGAPVGTDASAILIGGDASNNFHGYIDEVKIFGYERTAAQVKTDYIEGASGAGSNIAVGIGGTTMPSPNLWWRFDEGSGTTANNAGSNGSTYNGAITSGTWTLSGKFDKALTFTASSSVADTITDPGSTNSLSLWVYPTTSAASKTLITSGKLTTDASSRPIYGTCTGTALSLNTWTHIAAVSNGAGSCAVYQNGAATSTNTTGVSFGTSFNVGGSSFTGSIDEVKFYNVALTADQVKVDMNNAGALSVASTGGEAATFSDGAATLVGFYPLDENTGIAAGSTADRSGGGFNGTLTAIDATDWIPGIKGSALNLDGAAEYVDVGAGPGTVRSVTFWVKPATTTEYFINLASTTDYIWNNAGTLTATGLSSPTFYVNGIPTTTFSTIGAWSHVAVVTASAESAGNLDIGRTQNANYLEGAIDEVKLFSTALTQAQVMFEYNRGGPIAWYRMDECQGTVINDLSGNSLTGTLTIGTSGTNTLPGNCLSNTSSHAWNNGKTGKINNAMSFDDTDDYVSVADNNALDLTSGLSISAWVKTAANEANNVIVSKGASYEMGVTNTGALYWDGAGAQVDDGKTLVGSGTWHHVVVTNNDTTATFYVDGVQTGTATAGVDVDNTTALYIGYDGANYFDGLIDEVRVFNYPLSASQVKNVMTNGSVRFE